MLCTSAVQAALTRIMLRFSLVLSATHCAAAYHLPAPASYQAARLSFCRRAAAPIASETDIEDIRWLPPIDPSAADVSEGYVPAEGATVMPLFPLGVTYLPYTTPVLNIFEPRYRAMYNDILFSGARRFMVCNVDSTTGRLAETGVIFYLDELKEVSEQTADRVKYVGSHSVIGRVNLKKVLNPPVAATRESYLKAEVVELVDEDADESLEEEEAAIQTLFEELVDIQGTLGEEPRFTAAVKATLSFGRGTPTTAAERQSGGMKMRARMHAHACTRQWPRHSCCSLSSPALALLVRARGVLVICPPHSRV